jgi:hypothetical protein
MLANISRTLGVNPVDERLNIWAVWSSCAQPSDSVLQRCVCKDVENVCSSLKETLRPPSDDDALPGIGRSLDHSHGDAV